MCYKLDTTSTKKNGIEKTPFLKFHSNSTPNKLSPSPLKHGRESKGYEFIFITFQFNLHLIFIDIDRIESINPFTLSFGFALLLTCGKDSSFSSLPALPPLVRNLQFFMVLNREKSVVNDWRIQNDDNLNDKVRLAWPRISVMDILSMKEVISNSMIDTDHIIGYTV